MTSRVLLRNPKNATTHQTDVEAGWSSIEGEHGHQGSSLMKNMNSDEKEVYVQSSIEEFHSGDMDHPLEGETVACLFTRGRFHYNGSQNEQFEHCTYLQKSELSNLIVQLLDLRSQMDD